MRPPMPRVRPSSSRPLAALALSLLVGGCMTGDGMQTKLRDASTDYNKALRWRDIDRAAEFLPAESQQAFLAAHEEYAEDLVVVDYELTRLDLDKATGVAASRAQIWWHADDSTVVEHTMVDQLWQFHEGKFVLVDERRASGERLGLFAEFVEDDHPWLPGLLPYRKAHHIGEDNKKGRRANGKATASKRKPAAPPPGWGPHRGVSMPDDDQPLPGDDGISMR